MGFEQFLVNVFFFYFTLFQMNWIPIWGKTQIFFFDFYLKIQENESCQTVLFLTIQFSINHLCALSLNVKQSHFTQVLPLWVWVDLWAMAMKGFSAFPKTTVASPSDYFKSYPGHSLGLITQQRCSWCILHPKVQPISQQADEKSQYSLINTKLAIIEKATHYQQTYSTKYEALVLYIYACYLGVK